MNSVASALKSALGTGGTAAEHRIELQDPHEERVRGLLTGKGYAVGD